MKLIITATLLLLAAGPAWGQELRPLCSDRPSLGYSACTVDPGHFQADVGLGDWQLDKQRDSRTDTVTALDANFRLGLADKTELRVGWTAYGHVRDRDRMTSEVDRVSGIGDVTLGLRQAVVRPESGQPGFSLALQPYATLPSGRREVGASDWGAGFIMPLGYRLNDTFVVNLSPEVDAAPNEDRHGRHLAYGNVFGLGTSLSKKLRMTTEIAVLRDRDPDEGDVTETRAALSFGYEMEKLTQLDVLAVAGLNRNTPDVELSFGISHKF